ncbi:aminoacyl-tRNA hydrolase [Antarcticibacterium sp. 1MA-6-2]|uniref:alternative ribosome rescue aminoacyl-tRNA hydrolase ArfB n=1 Tax=Antarcticibacterium sp. 1MA-6-2 TaxID=2908210 RepID=UPI001F1EF449|nr:alternative ribosome rescue aminoacyl-tRNA hydrolase ArfB [Antarcticibacterium sp. 1MA-6-2]UJH89933.1 aminoacyl-tRNA hydrolase [Antarcticibacterium sp. 1MA-6-2]
MPDLDALVSEATWKAVRSSGPGGQHVNKTASKVVVQFDVPNSSALNDEEKQLILQKLSSRLTLEGILILEGSSTRSQHKNKELTLERLKEIILNSLKKQKPRKKTKPSKASKLKRLRAKKIQGEKKQNRQNPLQ